MNWFEIEFVLLKQLSLQPSELEQMEFYRVQYLMENYRDYNKKENAKRKEQETKQRDKYGSMNPNKGLKNYMKGNPYKGGLGKMKPPKF